MSWYVYLVECGDGSLYCGVTTNPEHRVYAHNGLRPGGAKYTRSRRPVRLAACVKQADKSSALRLEETIKKAPRSVKVERLLAAARELGPENQV